MKIIYKGEASVEPWWLGKECVCSRCNRCVVLEADDDLLAQEWIRAEADKVVVLCLNCRGQMIAKKD